MNSDHRTLNVPRATYRFQFHEGFPLRQALALVPYLQDLGISHIYTSPLFKARPHSKHGYDTCDFNQLNPELGTEKDLAELVGELRRRDMGLVMDIVPNHMGIGGRENHWWWDVLARGPESPYVTYFDIDWRSPDPRLRGKVLVPVLGDRYHKILARRELKVAASGPNWELHYGDNAFPVNLHSVQTVQASPDEINSDPDKMDALIEQQFYRLTWYGRGDGELNYRRFCNIADLPGLRVDDEKVFNQVFDLTKKWLERGWFDGLRVDHVDGLRDPEQFLQRLRQLAPKQWIVIEKILEQDEPMPVTWPVAGTTGYDFMNQAGGLFVDPDGESHLTDLYTLYSGKPVVYSALVREKKRLVLRTLFAAEVEHLTELLVRVAAGHARYRDFTRAELAGALTEFVACFPVYRIYAGVEWNSTPIHEATEEARRTQPDLPSDLIDFIRDLLLARGPVDAEKEFAERFQQLSAATMAKGVEDTAFYCYNRFVALNEVGGNPGQFGIDADKFHRYCENQQMHWPNSMLASSTHDTKRSEDVRARLYLLSEIPREWREAVGRWSNMNKRHRQHGLPSLNSEYLYYQTLVGAWPLPADRAIGYMQKAAHETKVHAWGSTEMIECDKALEEFIHATLDDKEFVADLEKFVEPLLQPGCINSLAQTLLKLTAPGVPDTYQGAELWERSLVDPDNRRPVDFKERQEVLEKAKTLSAAQAWNEWKIGLPKHWLIRQVLQLRARCPKLFSAEAKYVGLKAAGKAEKHVVVFKRGENMVTIVPRLVMGLHGDWGDTKLPIAAGNWKDELTGRKFAGDAVALARVLAEFPVALLVREGMS